MGRRWRLELLVDGKDNSSGKEDDGENTEGNGKHFACHEGGARAKTMAYKRVRIQVLAKAARYFRIQTHPYAPRPPSGPPR